MVLVFAFDLHLTVAKLIADTSFDGFAYLLSTQPPMRAAFICRFADSFRITANLLAGRCAILAPGAPVAGIPPLFGSDRACSGGANRFTSSQELHIFVLTRIFRNDRIRAVTFKISMYELSFILDNVAGST